MQYVAPFSPKVMILCELRHDNAQLELLNAKYHQEAMCNGASGVSPYEAQLIFESFVFRGSKNSRLCDSNNNNLMTCKPAFSTGALVRAEQPFSGMQLNFRVGEQI